ncbi:MAG: hypothetical protein PHV74_13880 [Dehalococcoidia bacterium]|nr:hypothetical protein [Dehalococcoidia bacterium]
MDKDQAIAALQAAAASIQDKPALRQEFQRIIDEFERSLKSNTSGSQVQNDSFHPISTPVADFVTDPSRYRGGQRAIPPDMVPTIDSCHGMGWGYKAITNFLREEHGLSVNWTTVRNVIQRKGVYSDR